MAKTTKGPYRQKQPTTTRSDGMRVSIQMYFNKDFIVRVAHIWNKWPILVRGSRGPSDNQLNIGIIPCRRRWIAVTDEGGEARGPTRQFDTIYQ